jgi:hypothetical protein
MPTVKVDTNPTLKEVVLSAREWDKIASFIDAYAKTRPSHNDDPGSVVYNAWDRADDVRVAVASEIAAAVEGQAGS